MYTLNVSTSSACPEVTFTCYAVNVPSFAFRWFDENIPVATYLFSPSDLYPLVLVQSNAVQIVISAASLNEDNQDLISILSTATVNTSALQGQLSCGSFIMRSNLINARRSCKGMWSFSRT